MRLIRIFGVLLCFCSSMSPSFAGSYEDAEAAIAQNRHTIAYQILLPLAKQGDVLAQQKIAALERDGHGRYDKSDGIIGIDLPVIAGSPDMRRDTLKQNHIDRIESMDNASFEELMATARELSNGNTMNFVPKGDSATEAARLRKANQPKPFSLSKALGASDPEKQLKTSPLQLTSNTSEFEQTMPQSDEPRKVVIVEEASEMQQKINEETLKTLTELQRKIVELDEKSDLRTRMVEIERAKRIAAGNEKRRNLEVRRITARIRSELNQKISKKYETLFEDEITARVEAERLAWQREQRLQAAADRQNSLDINRLNRRFRNLLSNLEQGGVGEFLSAQQELLSSQSAYLTEQYLSTAPDAAAEQQLRKQVNLGMAFFKGVETEPNNLHAFAWWQYAAIQGSEEAKLNMNIVKTRMTQSEKEQAMRFAKELTEGIL